VRKIPVALFALFRLIPLAAPFAELALIVPVFAMPPPIVLLFTKSATVVPKGPTAAPGVIVPALVTAPVIEVPVIEMKLVVEPAGLVTEACGVVMASPAFAGAAEEAPRARWWRGVNREG
jgi:hypothetical protein